MVRIEGGRENCTLVVDYFKDISPECSGHGTCNFATNECVCIDGWSGKSDWLNSEGFDCQINISAIRALWVCNLIFTVAIVIKSKPMILESYKKFQSIKSELRKRGKPYSLRKNVGLLAITIHFGGCIPAQIALSIYKIVYPLDAQVGVEVLPTIIWFTHRTAFYAAASIFQPSLLSSMLANNRHTEHLIRLNYKVSIFITVLIILVSLVGFINIASRVYGEFFSMICVATYYASQAFCLLLLALQAAYVRKEISKVLMQSYELTKDANTLGIRDRMAALQSEVTRQTLAQVLVYSLLASIPYMWNKHDYLLPILWLVPPIIGLKLVRSVSSGKSSNHRTDSIHPTNDTSSNRKSSVMDVLRLSRHQATKNGGADVRPTSGSMSHPNNNNNNEQRIVNQHPPDLAHLDAVTEVSERKIQQNSEILPIS